MDLKFESHENFHVATFGLKSQIVNTRQYYMSLVDCLKKFQANELVKEQMPGVIWEESITALAKLRSMRAGTTLTDVDEEKM